MRRREKEPGDWDKAGKGIYRRGVRREDRGQSGIWSQETPCVSSGLAAPGKTALSPAQFQSGNSGLWQLPPYHTSQSASLLHGPRSPTPSQPQPWSTSTSANYPQFGNTSTWTERMVRLLGAGQWNLWVGEESIMRALQFLSCPSLDLAFSGSSTLQSF